MSGMEFNFGLNFRFISILPTEWGLFRSGNLDELTLEQILFLNHSWGVKYCIDLRTSQEIQTCSHLNWEKASVDRFHIPIGDFKAEFRAKHNPSPLDYGKYYMKILEDEASQIKEIFRILMLARFRGVIYGCSAGKDRTGVITFLILLLSQAEIDEIKDDYALSTVYINRCLDRFEKSWIKRGMTKEEYQRRISSKPEAIGWLYDLFLSEYKDITKYFNLLGFTDCQIQEMKRLLHNDSKSRGAEL